MATICIPAPAPRSPNYLAAKEIAEALFARLRLSEIFAKVA